MVASVEKRRRSSENQGILAGASYGFGSKFEAYGTTNVSICSQGILAGINDGYNDGYNDDLVELMVE